MVLLYLSGGAAALGGGMGGSPVVITDWIEAAPSPLPRGAAARQFRGLFSARSTRLAKHVLASNSGHIVLSSSEQGARAICVNPSLFMWVCLVASSPALLAASQGEATVSKANPPLSF